MTRRRPPHLAAASDPQWYKDAVVYELRVGAFQDSDEDGIGDFRGLTSRLDYLQDLGVTALWLLPFYPSPMRDDGYDIADYERIHPQCGTLEDFRVFLREAHRRGLRVITELVINHTSDQHPWFQRARRAPAGSKHRDYYVWSDTPEKYREARVIFKDFEPSNWSWDPVAKAYFWHRFFSHQPDLNFDSAEVRRSVLKVLDFWLRMGVDGLRLDAVPYLFEREGTSCENLPETHAFLKELRRHVDANFQDRLLLAEANQWPEDAVAYFGAGDECHMAFHFPVMPRLFMALHMEDRFPILDILNQTPPIPENCQWALFLRNHDELTLEMVTDEERDYMYRVYAHDLRARINLGIRRRLAPLLGADRRRIELLNALLLSLPGTPILYYGDELGMGDNIYLGDRNGVRTPMQWSSDRNAGFSRANPQRLHLPVVVDAQYHYESLNVEAQQANLHSLLLWMKRLIALRKRYKALSRGTIEFLTPRNARVLAFIRRHGDERVLVVANLSRFVDFVELDLSAYRGMVAVEVFGRHAFPRIGDLPYLLTLGPHAFYWFELKSDADTERRPAALVAAERPHLIVEESWERLLRAPDAAALEAAIATALPTLRWYGGKSERIKGVKLVASVAIPLVGSTGQLAIFSVVPMQGEAAHYAIPLVHRVGAPGEPMAGILADVEVKDRGEGTVPGVLLDAMHDPEFTTALLDAIRRRRSWTRGGTELVATATRAFNSLRGPASEPLAPTPLKGEQSNTSVRFGDRLILKLYRRLAPGVNPELEVGRYLTDHGGAARVAKVAGAIEYRSPRAEPMTVAILQAFVPNEGDAWTYTLEQVGRYLEHASVHATPTEEIPVPTAPLVALTAQELPPLASGLLGGYLENARLLGQRIAELHVALGRESDDPLFGREPFTTLYQRSLYQSMRNLVARSFRKLRQQADALPPDLAPDATRLLQQEAALLEVAHRLVGRKLSGARIRCHGDLHLGQVLRTGTDFVIIDFEGEPARSFAERRIRRSPLRDVAGMLRSFDYAAHAGVRDAVGRGMSSAEARPRLERWARFWRQWVSSAFLRAYLNHMTKSGLLPATPAETDVLLRYLVLEKSIYELGYELDHRIDWVAIPIRGILGLLEEKG